MLANCPETRLADNLFLFLINPVEVLIARIQLNGVKIGYSVIFKAQIFKNSRGYAQTSLGGLQRTP